MKENVLKLKDAGDIEGEADKEEGGLLCDKYPIGTTLQQLTVTDVLSEYGLVLEVVQDREALRYVRAFAHVRVS